MSRSTTRPSRALAPLSLVAVAAAALALSGCSAGQVAQTAIKESSVQGVNATVGDIAIRNAGISFPPAGLWKKGDTAGLTMRLVNTGLDSDRLIKVTSSVAPFASLDRQPADTCVIDPAAGPTPSASASASASASPSAVPSRSAPSKSVAPSGSAAPGASASASGIPAPSSTSPEEVKISLDLPAGKVIGLDENARCRIQLEKLTEDINPAQIVEVTLTFERGGEVTLKLPIMTPLNPQPRGAPVKGVEEPAESQAP